MGSRVIKFLFIFRRLGEWLEVGFLMFLILVRLNMVVRVRVLFFVFIAGVSGVRCGVRFLFLFRIKKIE